MDTIQFVQKAVSKDKTRYNLNYVYRDRTRLVATDGHRLHFKDQPEINAPHFIGATVEAEFPDYSRVIPSNPPLISAEIPSAGINRKALKMVVDASKLIDKRGAPMKLELSKDSVHAVRFSVSGEGISASYETEGFSAENVVFSIYLNGQYVLDALPEHEKYTSPMVTFDFYGEASPILIGQTYGSALIMPIKAPK